MMAARPISARRRPGPEAVTLLRFPGLGPDAAIWLSEQGSLVVALPMKIAGGSGGPLRIIARP